MPLRIVVPVDGSELAGHAVAWAVAFARRTGATVSICSVVDPMLACMPIAAGAALDPGPMLRLLEEDANGFCTAAAARAATEHILTKTVVLHGPPAEAIEAFARESNADIVVLGTHARRGLARGVLGSVTAAVVRSSEAAVLAIRAETIFAEIGPVVVAVDESDASAAAARFALKIARALNVAIHLVHVHGDVDSHEAARDNAERTNVQQATLTPSQTTLRTIAREAAAAGVACTEEIRHGDVVETLMAAVGEHRGSILATGTHGRGPVGRLFLGSVAQGLVRESVVPVLVVRDAT